MDGHRSVLAGRHRRKDGFVSAVIGSHPGHLQKWLPHESVRRIEQRNLDGAFVRVSTDDPDGQVGDLRQSGKRGEARQGQPRKHGHLYEHRFSHRRL